MAGSFVEAENLSALRSSVRDVASLALNRDSGGGTGRGHRPGGSAVAYAYDAAGKVTRIAFPDPAEEVTFSYDSRGLRLAAGV